MRTDTMVGVAVAMVTPRRCLHALLWSTLLAGVWCSPDRRVVYPLRADAHGRVVSLDVTHHAHTRARRSAAPPESSSSNSSFTSQTSSSNSSRDDNKLYIVINGDNEELLLDLTPNTRLVTRHTVVEWVLGDGTSVIKRPQEDCFYVGRLTSHPESLVAISNCDGLTGYIQAGNDSYFIEPLKGEGGVRGDQQPQPHLIYKVKSVTARLNLSLQQDQQFSGDDQPSQEQEEEEEREEELVVLAEEEGEEEVVAEAVEENMLEEEEEKVFPRRSKGGRGSRRGHGRSRVSDNPSHPPRRHSHGTRHDPTRHDPTRHDPTRHDPTRHAHHTPKFRQQKNSGEQSEETFLEFDAFLARRRRRRSIFQEKDGLRATLQRSRARLKEDIIMPKFLRHLATPFPPKFARPKTQSNNTNNNNNDVFVADRVGRSTMITMPKFEPRQTPWEPLPTRGKREDGENRDERVLERGNEEREMRKVQRKERTVDEEIIIEESENKNRKKKNKRKKCKRNEGERELEGERDKKCRGRKKQSKEEREKKREERKLKKRLEKEKRRKTKEKKRKEKREKREKKKKKRKEVGPTMESSVPRSHTEALDPFEGEDWQGYSPDLFWEMQVAAGSQAGEVVLGAALASPAPPRWLELVVAVDHTVVAFHGEQDVEKYVFTLFNIVSAIYEDASLQASLELVMLRIIFYKDQKHSQVKAGLAKKSLEAVNRWSERLHNLSPPHLQHDMAVWLTRTDLGGPSGYAPVAGVCDPPRSCTLNRDEGLTSAFIIAHEMGHVLGLSHDGDGGAGNTCEDEGFMGSVMAPLVAATFSRFHWSSCSKKEYHARADAWSCMENQPQWGNATTVSSTITYQYSLDDQCRMEFGEGFGLCGSLGVSDPCTHLWCANASTPHLCKTKKGPPLEGTTCGDGKWCRHGYCEAVGRGGGADEGPDGGHGESPVRHNPQDGGWGPWGGWGPCSTTCGTGVSFRTRKCDNPPPAWGGARCQGKREEWRVCGTDECPLPRLDPRAQQCRLLPRIVKLDARKAALRWRPYEPKARRKKCRLSCYSHETNEVHIGREHVVDGTPCSYDTPHHICVQGKCIPLGCDHVVGSRAAEDECGVCGGDGNTCDHQTHVYQDTPTPGEYVEVARLPAGARNIHVRETTPSDHLLALRVALRPTNTSQDYLLNAGGEQEPPKDFIGEGARFHYSENNGSEVLEAKGPILRPLALLVFGVSSGSGVRVVVTYSVRPHQQHYQWEVGPYTACTVTCGGGEQTQTLVCRDRRSDLQVFHDRCAHLPRPALTTAPCNTFGCGARWVTGEWEHCSTTCGTAGVQARQVSCVSQTHVATTNWSAGVVAPGECAPHPAPPHTQECMREPCPAHWLPVGWTQCSVSCGEGGVQTRLWECEGGGGNEVTYDCGGRPNETRPCHAPTPCPAPACLRDASEFCQLPVLHRYCRIPKYRELCCLTCSSVQH